MRVERATFTPNSSLGRSRESMATSNSGVFEEEKPAAAAAGATAAASATNTGPGGIIKEGTLQGGFLPLKGKGKSYYVVLSERAMELYDNEKAYTKKKPVKFTIDLAVAFNVHNEHFETKLGKCVCVMQPNDTLVLSAGEKNEQTNQQINQEWYEAILGTAVPARALRLGRCVQPMEFFESAYDVEIAETPRAKIAYRRGEEMPIQNLIDKYPHVAGIPPQNLIEKQPHVAGKRRLCFYAHTIFLCDLGVEPAKEDDLPPAGVPPYRAEHFFEMQRKFISNFGFRENYFILMMGRGSPMGACEMWAMCETNKIAEHVHNTLNMIIDRESERRMKMNNGIQTLMPSVPTLPTHRGHRNRSHTQPHRPRLASEILARQTNSPLAHLARKSSTGTMACTAGCNRTPPTSLGDPSTSGALPVPGSRHSFAAPGAVKGLVVHSSIFPARRQSETIKEEVASSYQAMDPTDEAKKRWEELMRGDTQSRRACSTSTTRSSTDETEDSGGTLKCFDETEDSGGTLKMGGDSKPHTPNGSIRNLSMIQQSPRQFVPISNKADHLSSSEDDADVISAGTNTSTGGESVSAGEVDYTHMDVVNWTAAASGDSNLIVPLYKLDTPRSFLSSSDSCYSSMAERQQLQREQQTQQQEAPPTGSFRTYSFGPGHPSYQRPTVTASPQEPEITSSNDGVEAGGDASNTNVDATAKEKEDNRKRAFSLGNKSFFAYFNRPFRKISGNSGRARQSVTSTSGASLASSTVSSGPPPSSMSSNHISSIGYHPAGPGVLGMMGDKDDLYNRNRSGSIGSGRSTPYSKRSGHIDASRDHLMELDFGGGPSSSHHGLGRCGSGSVGSVESPSRSRTSSFGGNLKKDEKVDDPDAGLTPSQILLKKDAAQKAKQLSFDDAPASHDNSDYVETEPPAVPVMSMTSPRMTSGTTSGHHHHHSHHHHHHHHHQQQQQHHSPEHALPPAGGGAYPGGVLDVMGKTHDARSSQYFETIEETTSGRSSRASSVCEDSARGDEDDYTLMEIGVSAAAAAPAATSQQLQPAANDNKQGNRSRSASPCARRVDSTSTLQSVSSSDRSDRENSSIKEAKTAQPAQPQLLQQQQPPRQKISTQSEGPPPSLLTAPLGLPKRSSVPVLKDAASSGDSCSKDDPAAAALNYAYLQPAAAAAGSAATAAAAATANDSRTRSKSGIICTGKEAAAAAAAPTEQQQQVDYAVFKPLP